MKYFDHMVELINLFFRLTLPTGIHLTVSGHGSSSGQLEKTNRQIALVRAKNVRDFLILNWFTSNQIDPSKAFGSQMPIVQNDTPEHMAKNRRVEIDIEITPGVI